MSSQDREKLGVDQVGEDRQRGGEADARVEHLAELVRPSADEALVVGSGQPQGGYPERWECQAKAGVLIGDVAVETEPEGRG